MRRGRIGRTMYKSLIGSTEFEAVFGVDVNGADDLPYPVYKSFAASPLDADVVIDFSSPSALDDILAYAAEKKAEARARHHRLHPGAGKTRGICRRR